MAGIRHGRLFAQPQAQRKFPVSICCCVYGSNVGFEFYPDGAHGGWRWQLWISFRVLCDAQQSVETKGRRRKAVMDITKWTRRDFALSGACFWLGFPACPPELP